MQLQFNAIFPHLCCSTHGHYSGDEHVQYDHRGSKVASIDVYLVGVVYLRERVGVQTIDRDAGGLVDALDSPLPPPRVLHRVQ